MKKELRFALYAIKKNIQSSAELRTSFITNIFGMAINNTAFIILWIFFVKEVGVINGWGAANIIGLQGFVALCFGIVYSVGAGIRKLPEYVTGGSFDRFMLSPKNILLRVTTAAFGVSAIGDIVFGVVCIILYAILIKASALQIGMMLILIMITSIVFFATAVIIYSVSFLFTDANSVTMSFAELFLTPSMFNGGAIQGPLRFIFTFLIPSLLIGTLPIEAIQHASIQKFLLVVGLSVVWLILSIFIFNRGVKKYESSNLMTFGS